MKSLSWWLIDENLFYRVQFDFWVLKATLTKYASLLVWDAHCQRFSVQEQWPQIETSLGMNVEELCAVRFALTSFSDILEDKKVLIQTTQ